METSGLEILAVHSIEIIGQKMLVMHLQFTSPWFCRHFFFVDHLGRQIAFAKESIEGEISWTGHSITACNRIICGEIERLTDIELPVQPNTDPFDYAGELPVTIKSFYIDGMKVEKAASPFEGVDAIYYRLHVEERWSPKIAYIRVPLNNDWEWRPVTKIAPWEFEFMVEMITEYEDGTYEAYRQMNDGLVLLLQQLKHGIKPVRD